MKEKKRSKEKCIRYACEPEVTEIPIHYQFRKHWLLGILKRSHAVYIYAQIVVLGHPQVICLFVRG